MADIEKSEALTRAAQKLSAARTRWSPYAPRAEYERLSDALESAEIAYRAAYLAYTNPFGVVKTS